ncbi:hypothetical protein B0A53_02119 [Rhodotorula sp. CCFEE 5036]|nr:hypothetical protein B0A53_02119 [Rhodotorula sp. CCFEE 5036]
MHTAVPRVARGPDLKLDPALGSVPLALPGLISSLRPIRRNAAQLADEAALLRRFMYKHKNQHKGQRWWKRIVEVDRCASRALEELSRWLAGFGMSPDNEDHGSIGRQELCRGLLAAPRVLLIVEKNVQVLLNCAGILEQLVDSRAFLAFALVVVALAARLHSLFGVLFDDLDRATATLSNLVEANKLTDVVKPHLARLPRELRRFVPSDHAAPSSATLPTPASLDEASAKPIRKGADDLGSVVARPLASSRAPSSSKSATPSLPSRTISRTASPAATPRAPSVASETNASMQKNAAGELVGLGHVVERKKKSEEVGDPALVVPRKRSSTGSSEKPRDGPAVKKRVRADLAAGDVKQIPPGSAFPGGSLEAPEPRTTSDKAPVVKKKKKKKKKVKKDGDEIDDIFG